jgi:hypothetical protein
MLRLPFNCGVRCANYVLFLNLVRCRRTVAVQVGLKIPLRSIFNPSYSPHCINTKRWWSLKEIGKSLQ